LTGLDYLVTEQPDRALDMFLKLMDANADTIETHFALGSLYRRRGEVERAIRIHQNLLAREALAPEHREQALLALAQDYLRAGLLDRAEGLVSAGERSAALARERARCTAPGVRAAT
jgi:lipopolysaccharide biosynthesis regulator YciM